MFIFIVFLCVCFVFFVQIGTAVANSDRRHLRFIRPHDDGPMKHEGKRRKLYEKADMQSDISDVALFLDEHEEMLERGTLPNCGTCNSTCNPCAKEPNVVDGKVSCDCKHKKYCIQKGCKVNVTWLLERLEPFTYFTPEKLKLMCAFSS